MSITKQVIVILCLILTVGCTVTPTPTAVPPTRPPADTVTPFPTEPSQPNAPPTALPTKPPPPTSEPTTPPTIDPTPEPADPFSLISQEHLFAFMEDLTSIQPYSGWRNSASSGEAEALDYVTNQLQNLDYLQNLGLELERQSFRVFMATELWDSQLHLTVNGQEIEVPAAGLRGPRNDIAQALRFDSDGVLNDSDRNPAEVQGELVLVHSADELDTLSAAEVGGKIVFLNYHTVNRVMQGSTRTAVEHATRILQMGPAGLVLVTQNSNKVGDSHGYGVGDVSALNWVETQPPVPILYARLEDMGPAGIRDWDDLTRVENARMVWDADIFSPGATGNLAARIPGADPSQAVILGAHIDSPNNPGALDDGSGSVMLLEVARVLNKAQTQPPVDLYLVWFGSEEIGLVGAAHFVATHQDLLDRTLAMLEIDDLTRPLDGLNADITLITWPYNRLGDDRLTLPDYLSQAAAQHGVSVLSEGVNYFHTEGIAFNAFDVPNADLIYTDDPAFDAAGGWHYAAQVHSPYDTVEQARVMGDELEQMTRVALSAALELGRDLPELRVTNRPDRRALFVASHTESIHMMPATLVDLGMALHWAGFDVDMIPYGQAVTPADLVDADLVFALPVHDYPSPDGDPDLYYEAWSQDEIAALEAYTAGGGLLVLCNSANRLKYYNQILDPNEDWPDMNALAERFGITYHEGSIPEDIAYVDLGHPLVKDLIYLELAPDNGVPLTVSEGQILVQAAGAPVMALVDHGDGQVLALADLGMLSGNGGEPANLTFWLNLANYVRSR